jgi:hypothetical protein
MDDSPIKNWIPYKLADDNGRPQCHWLNTFKETFTEPFFDGTIRKCRSIDSQHLSKNCVSSLAMLEVWAESLPDVEPNAIIFHTSRCGSTLVSQLLSLSSQNIVLSEVPFFDDLLRMRYKYPINELETLKLFRAAVKFYAQKRTGHEEHLYIKTDSWHMFFYEQLRQIYPTVPIILMYRDPNEVYRSLKKVPGMQSVAGMIEPGLLGFEAKEIAGLHPDEYLASVLEKFLAQYHHIINADGNFLLLNYSEPPLKMVKKITEISNTSLTPQHLTFMEERAQFHSKKPGELFSELHEPASLPLLNKAIDLYHSLNERT